jgi:hypothetical protein
VREPRESDACVPRRRGPDPRVHAGRETRDDESQGRESDECDPAERESDGCESGGATGCWSVTPAGTLTGQGCFNEHQSPRSPLRVGNVG